jgi:hypothetical protein
MADQRDGIDQGSGDDGERRADKAAADHDAGAKRASRTPPTIDLDATDVSSVTSESSNQSEVDPSPPSEPDPPTPERSLTWLLPALSGAAAALVVIAVAWLAGGMGGKTPQAIAPAQHDALASEVTALERRVTSLAATTKSDSTEADPAVSKRLATVESTLDATRAELAELRRQIEETIAIVAQIKTASAGGGADNAAVTSRLTQLEQAVRALSGNAAAQRENVAEDTGLRRLAIATALRSSVRDHQPYGAQLAAAKQIAERPALLAPLDGFAASGLPDDAALARDLLAALSQSPGSAMSGTKASPVADSASNSPGLLQRLKASAAKLVRIERTDSAATLSDQVSAELASIASAARRADLAAAQRQLAALPQQSQAALPPPLQAWRDRITKRDAALAAAETFANDAATALAAASNR